MGLFFNKNLEIASPCSGKVIKTSLIKDETFAQNLLGTTCGIIPSDGKIVAPIDGKITVLHASGHAMAIKHKSGLNVMVHVGIDTVNMNLRRKPGEALVGFNPKVQIDDVVKAGQLINVVDLNAIKKAKYDTTTMLIVVDDEGLKSRTFTPNTTSGDIKAGAVIGIVK